jgi:antitoxin MazE
MQVARWGNSLAIRIPSAVVKHLELKEGDDVRLLAGDGKGELILQTREDRLAMLDRLREFSGRFPDGWKFDRDEANAR